MQDLEDKLMLITYNGKFFNLKLLKNVFLISFIEVKEALTISI